jgi:hypothetical protein
MQFFLETGDLGGGEGAMRAVGLQQDGLDFARHPTCPRETDGGTDAADPVDPTIGCLDGVNHCATFARHLCEVIIHVLDLALERLSKAIADSCKPLLECIDGHGASSIVRRRATDRPHAACTQSCTAGVKIFWICLVNRALTPARCRRITARCQQSGAAQRLPQIGTALDSLVVDKQYYRRGYYAGVRRQGSTDCDRDPSRGSASPLICQGAVHETAQPGFSYRNEQFADQLSFS